MARDKKFVDGSNQIRIYGSACNNCAVYLADRLIPMLPRLLPDEKKSKYQYTEWLL